MDPAQLQPGYRLDRYELLCPLAYGGMASVWLARFGGRLGFERMVVIKMILPQYSQDPRFKDMFLDEARIASKIEHSNVARILDVGEQNDNYFIVMEWVDGDSLSKILREVEQRKEMVPAGVAMRIVADAAAGLHAAHELKARDGTNLGVVHRDVSPQNILVANNGTTMIIDFGVAKARDRLSQETSAGQLKGKIRYMAPEQALGRAIDHRADIWALGAMLYEMFAGAPPYDGANEVATLHKLTSGQRPAPLPSTVPELVANIVTRALGYEPEERYETALELNLALENAMVQLNEPTSAAVVSAYTAELLRDRKKARHDAVQNALDKARRRDDRRAAAAQAFANAPPSEGAIASSSGVSSHHGGPPSSRLIPSVPPPGETSSGPNRTGERMSLGEMPSSATLGSANVEFFPDPSVDESRRRRYVTAAAVGVSLAAALIGIILIVTTVGKRSAAPRNDEPPVAMTVTAPSPTVPLSAVTAPSPTAVPSSIAPPASQAAATAPAVTATQGPTTTPKSTEGSSPTAKPPKHVTPPTPPPTTTHESTPPPKSTSKPDSRWGI
jgi:serine/threonine-protein kinase